MISLFVLPKHTKESQFYCEFFFNYVYYLFNCLNSDGSNKIDLILCWTWHLSWTGPLTWRGWCCREVLKADSVSTWLTSRRARGTTCSAIAIGHHWKPIWRRSNWPVLASIVQGPLCWSCMNPSGAVRDEACQPRCLSATTPYCADSEGLCVVVWVSWPNHDVVPCCKQGLCECPYGEMTPRDVLLPPTCRRDDYHSGWCVLFPASACDRQAHRLCPLHLRQIIYEDSTDDPPWHIDKRGGYGSDHCKCQGETDVVERAISLLRRVRLVLVGYHNLSFALGRQYNTCWQVLDSRLYCLPPLPQQPRWLPLVPLGVTALAYLYDHLSYVIQYTSK